MAASAAGTAFIPYIGNNLADVLCEQHERIVGNDNCVRFTGMKLQIPADGARHHYVTVAVRVHCYVNGTLGIFHGPRKLAGYDAQGNLLMQELKKAADVSARQFELCTCTKADNSCAIKPDISICSQHLALARNTLH